MSMMYSGWRNVLGAGLLVVSTSFAITKAIAIPAQIFTTFSWDSSPDQAVAGYALYYGMANQPITNRVDTGSNLTATIPLYVGTNYSLFVVAYSEGGMESPPSNILYYTPPPMSRIQVNELVGNMVGIRFQTSPLAPCRIEWTSVLNPPDWQTLEEVTADANGNIVVTDSPADHPEGRYYRAVKL